MTAVEHAVADAVLARAVADPGFAAALARALAPHLADSPPDSPSRSELLTVAEAADYLRCSPQRVYNLRSSGRLTRLGDGRSAKVRRRDLDALLAGVGGVR